MEPVAGHHGPRLTRHCQRSMASYPPNHLTPPYPDDRHIIPYVISLKFVVAIHHPRHLASHIQMFANQKEQISRAIADSISAFQTLLLGRSTSTESISLFEMTRLIAIGRSHKAKVMS